MGRWGRGRRVPAGASGWPGSQPHILPDNSSDSRGCLLYAAHLCPVASDPITCPTPACCHSLPKPCPTPGLGLRASLLLPVWRPVRLPSALRAFVQAGSSSQSPARLPRTTARPFWPSPRPCGPWNSKPKPGNIAHRPLPSKRVGHEYWGHGLPALASAGQHAQWVFNKQAQVPRKKSVSDQRSARFPLCPQWPCGPGLVSPLLSVEKTVQREWDVPRALWLIHSGTFWTRLLGLPLPCPVTGG